MNSMINRSGFLTAALCAAMLAGCNAVENVEEEPSAALPTQTAKVGGRIKDLGTRRPLVLQYNGADACLVPRNPAEPAGLQDLSECRFLGVANQEYSAFNFGARTVGQPYTISVKRQPFGKICKFQDGNSTLTGTVQANQPDIEISCTDDPAVPHYTVAVNIAPAAAGKPGLKAVLTTENGSCSVDVNGRSTITFSPAECPDSELGGYHRNATYVFNSQTNLPVFTWRVTASIPGATALAERTNCFVTNNGSAGLVPNTGGNVQDDGTAAAGTAPTGNIAAGVVTVSSCGFKVRVQADYSQPSAAVTTLPNIAADGITVALRSQPYGVDVAAAKISNFNNAFVDFMVPDANGEPTTTPYEAQSNPNAFYELVVKKLPAGMACIPGYSTTTITSTATGTQGTRSVGNITDGGGVLLRQPASAYIANRWLVDRVIRCRLIASNPPAAQLRGTYWQYSTTTTTTTVPGSPTNVVAVTAYNRNLLTFFQDGQFLAANQTTNGATASEGVEQGFYVYNPDPVNTVTGVGPATMIFTGTTDISGTGGLLSAGAFRTLTSVVKSSGTPKTITARASNTTTTGLVIATGGMTVIVNNGTQQNVSAATYSSLATLITAINTAANPGLNAAANIAFASGSEIRITAPTTGPVVLGGAALSALGLPASIPAGTSVTSTNAATAIATTVNVVVDWKLSEVGPDTRVATTNPLDGAWVTWDWQRQPAPVEDPRRVYVYQHAFYNAFHMGVNGIPNVQFTCFVGDFGLTGMWTRLGGGQGCTMTVLSDTSTNGGPPVRSESAALGSVDIPNPTTTTAFRDFPGRWPQSQNPLYTDGRPYSLVDYEIRLAGTVPSDPVCPTADKLTVWDTVNGTRKDTLVPPVPRLVLCRVTAN